MSERKRFTKLRALYQIWFMCIYTLPNNRLVLNNNIDSHNIIKDWHTSDRHIVFKRYTETQHLKLKKRHTLLIQIAYKTLRANINIYMYQFVLLNLPLDAKCGCYTLYMRPSVQKRNFFRKRDQNAEKLGFALKIIFF